MIYTWIRHTSIILNECKKIIIVFLALFRKYTFITHWQIFIQRLTYNYKNSNYIYHIMKLALLNEYKYTSLNFFSSFIRLISKTNSAKKKKTKSEMNSSCP